MFPYIDFERFCEYLLTFCPRCPIDLKISYAFRKYDLDGDGYISPRDLYDTLNILVGHTLSNQEIDVLVKKVFLEVDSAEKRVIDKDDFQKVK